MKHPTGPFCRRCGRPLPGRSGGEEELRCAACFGKQWAFSEARSIGPYDGALRLAVHRLKFRGQQDFGRVLADVLFQSVEPDWWSSVDCLIPVPLHPERQQSRGFNQAEVIASRLSVLTGQPFQRWLIRAVATQAQTGLSQRQRQQNVQGAFRLAPGQGGYARGKRLLLVDDVMTTGSTLGACARVLRQAGAADVKVATLAVTNLRGRL
jgi:ComF family protein